MSKRVIQYGLGYSQKAPYEVLFTKWLSYEDVVKLKGVEEMVEVYYNSGQFSHTLKRLCQAFPSPYAMFEALADYYAGQGLLERKHSRQGRFQILDDFIRTLGIGETKRWQELLTLDLYFRENSKSRPVWAAAQEADKENVSAFYQQEKERPQFLMGYEKYNYRQLINLTHWEVFREDVFDSGALEPKLVIFDYRNRDILTGNAQIMVLDYETACGLNHKIAKERKSE